MGPMNNRAAKNIGIPGRVSARLSFIMNSNQTVASDFSRRDFLRGSSMAALLAAMGAQPLQAAEAPAADPKKPVVKVKTAIIGLGPCGREILSTLQRLPEAEVVALCDNYPAMLRRSLNNAPGATGTEDYKTILENKDVKAVVIATPSHQHKEIALAALKAGKHVYCEAPMATTIEDAREISAAARAAVGQVFHVGLNIRSDPQRNFLLTFIRSGAIGKFVMARAQWHKKQSWRQTSPSAEREKTINWRLSQEISLGLIGEIGIHQIDVFNWYLKALPVAVSGFGGLIHWKDGRDVPDTAQVVYEYGNGVQGIFDCTIANSFDSDYDVIFGTDAAVMSRGDKSWLFKEVDSPLLGWEVYARKDVFYKETGIALVADATKSTPPEGAAAAAALTKTPVYHGLAAFLANAADVGSTVEDFKENYQTDDKKAIAKHLTTLKLQPYAGWEEGLETTVIAVKSREAIATGKRIEFQKDWFALS
jgi:predicted dehydrogenase